MTQTLGQRYQEARWPHWERTYCEHSARFAKNGHEQKKLDDLVCAVLDSAYNQAYGSGEIQALAKPVNEAVDSLVEALKEIEQQ